MTNTIIQEDATTVALGRRWIACYLLYDDNPLHADNAYCSNKFNWAQRAREKAQTEDAATLTETFNRVLLEDVENFVQKHMDVWECDRAEVEFYIARKIGEMEFSEDN